MLFLILAILTLCTRATDDLLPFCKADPSTFDTENGAVGDGAECSSWAEGSFWHGACGRGYHGEDDLLIIEVCPECGECIPHPTASPTISPSHHPSHTPTLHPSHHPTVEPSDHPTVTPSVSPSGSPSHHPTLSPSHHPTLSPTNHPSLGPTVSAPSHHPTLSPTHHPSVGPTVSPSHHPTLSPTHHPSHGPTLAPTDHPSHGPTVSPSHHPSTVPTTSNPTVTPSKEPSHSPTKAPTDHPSVTPTSMPTDHPTTSYPTNHPTTSTPTVLPTSSFPTKTPTLVPTELPTIHQYTKELTLDGNYDEVVGPNKELFLQECTHTLGVTCRDVRPGSIIITIAGTEEDVAMAEKQVEENGFTLPSFGAMEIASDDDSSNSSVLGIVILVCVVVAAGVLGSYLWYKKTPEEDEIDLNQMKLTQIEITDKMQAEKDSKRAPEQGTKEGGEAPQSPATPKRSPQRSRKLSSPRKCHQRNVSYDYDEYINKERRKSEEFEGSPQMTTKERRASKEFDKEDVHRPRRASGLNTDISGMFTLDGAETTRSLDEFDEVENTGDVLV